MGILDTMRDAASSIPATAVISGIAALNPVTAVVAAQVSAANAAASLLSGGSTPPAADTPKTDTPKTQSGTTQIIDGTPVTVNKVYDTVNGVNFVDAKESYASGVDDEGHPFVSTSNKLDADEKLATAYRYNNWKDTSDGGGAGLSLKNALTLAKAEEVSASEPEPEIISGDKSPVNTTMSDFVSGLSTLASIHPIGQLYNSLSALGSGGTIPTLDEINLDEIKKDNPVSNMISGVISTRDDAYESGGLAFIPAAAADILLPLDLANTGNKLFTGETVTTEDWIYAGIDAITLLGGAATMGAGYIPLRGLAKGLKVTGKALNVSGILGSLGVLFGGLGSGSEDPEGGDNGGDDGKTTNPTLITDPDANGGGVTTYDNSADESIILGLIDTIRGLITIGGTGDTYNSYSSGGGISGGTTTSAGESSGFTQYIPALLVAGLGIIAVYAITRRTA